VELERLARVALAPDESAAWQGLGAAKRRREWLMGRIAAKDAVRLHLEKARGLRLPVREIAILADERGRPHARVPLLAATGASPAVSIAHTDGVAVAVVSGRGDGIGIDVERLDRRRGDYERAAFGDDERLRLDAGPPAGRAARALRLFCAKEAAAKATGLGLMGSPLNLRILDADAALTHVVLEAAGRLAEALPDGRDRRFDAWIDDADGILIALAAGLPPGRSTTP
jgi:phosphopantetheinyl transferase